MHRLITLLLFYFVVSLFPIRAQKTGSTQNLVPNPGFESYHECPDHLEAIRFRRIPAWVANPPNCTPDYFNKCGARGYRVPKNRCGVLAANNGQAYIGMILRVGSPEGDPQGWYYREHVTAKLKRPLKKDYRYVIKMHLALSTYANYAIANIGVLFTKHPKRIRWNKVYVPQVMTPRNQFFDQPNQWVLVQDTMVAKGGEAFITIGEFNNFGDHQIKKITNSRKYRRKFNFNRAYYFIDDVSVVELDKVMIDTMPKITGKPLTNLEIGFDTDLGNIKRGEPVILKNIFFEFAKARLLPASFPELDKLVNLLTTHPQIKVRIMGHTDNVGTDTRNLQLSNRRAKSVVTYLKKQGIRANRLTFKGFGESRPIDSNVTKEGRQKNRRVEFVVL
ncbi:OmpA family protein [Microscilla marina]|uniref:OmpA/MotB, putative n=1 Tax=Microscilla marina ATCC 23134 TaxID=313606 RepID=A1ZHD9_MICM2|nr:OmpA family protein [Microscilla marina]EAY30408.1 OmpA/MotB, putative [Microscilla marina ATCC 23134]